MVRLFVMLSLFSCSFLYSGIYEVNTGYIFSHQELVYDDFNLHISCPEWQPRRYYFGVVPSSIGYFYVNNWAGDVGIYGSNRYVFEDNAESFYQSLHPLELNLLPYATPNASSCTTSRILSEELASISNLPAIKVVFELSFPNKKDEIVVSYIFTKPKAGLFSNSVVGYTYSVSCYKNEYEAKKEQLDTIVKNLKIR